jgi:hypothetical protein
MNPGIFPRSQEYLSPAGDQIVKKSFFGVIPSGFINQNKHFGRW